MTAGLDDALRAGAAGLYCAEAGTELLITHRSWLLRGDFEPFIVIEPAAAGQEMTASVDWDGAVTALEAGGLPCSSGERRVLRLAASIAGGIPVDLGEALTGLDRAGITAAACAVAHAGGHRGVTVTLPPEVLPCPVKGMLAMKWNLRLAAANRGIWKASELQKMLADHGLTVSAGKMSGLWSGSPASVKLDELDVICAVLGCGVEELLLPEPGKVTRPAQEQPRQAAAQAAGPAVTPRRRDGRSLPPP